MSSIDPEMRDVAVARVQALNTLDQGFPAALRLVTDDMKLNRSSGRRWADRKLCGEGDEVDGVPTQVLGGGLIRTATLDLLQTYEVAGGKSADDYWETSKVGGYLRSPPS